MPKSDIELTEILQVRVSRAALAAIKKSAKDKQSSVAAFVRDALYRQIGLIR